MSLPQDILSTPAVPADLLPPDNVGRTSLIESYEQGGVDLNDSSQGLQVKIWRARLVGGNIWVSGYPYSIETLLISDIDITELSLSFNQNMTPYVAYIAGGQAKLYYYNTSMGSMDTMILDPSISSVYLTMDDKRAVATQLNWNDVLLFYIRSGLLCYREQRESFAVERVLKTVVGLFPYIVKIGMNKSLRLQIELASLGT